MRKTYLNRIIALLISLLMALTCVACYSNSATEPQNDKQDSQQMDEAIYIEEDEEAEIHKVESDLSRFYGSWTAKSEKAKYMYGNVDITVNEDQTWSGNISELDLGGKWTDEGDHIHMDSKRFSFDLAYTEGGNIVMLEDMSDGELVTVLSRK